MSGIVGVVLAGGLARRMGGGDKPMTEIAGRPMLDHVVERLGAQVDAMVLNANGDPQRFAAWNLPVVADSIEGFAGPLAGVLAGLEWAAVHRPEARAVVSVAGDTPFFPTDLVKRFDAATNHDITAIALAASKGYAHPVFGLWPVECADDLRAFLEAGETRKVLAFVDLYHRVDVPFDDIADNDPFFNVNTPEDMAKAEEMARRMKML